MQVLTCRVIAIDESQHQVKHAQQQEGVVYRVAPAEATELPDCSADLVTSATGVHWYGYSDTSQQILGIMHQQTSSQGCH